MALLFPYWSSGRDFISWKRDIIETPWFTLCCPKATWCSCYLLTCRNNKGPSCRIEGNMWTILQWVQLLLERVNSTVWSIGYAVPYHMKELYDMLGYGLGLNSMQGREAKHIKLKNYVSNTCNARKQLRWAIVFRHEFVSLLWLREANPCYTSSKSQLVSYIPKKVQNGDCLTCNCCLSKSAAEVKL